MKKTAPILASGVTVREGVIISAGTAVLVFADQLTKWLAGAYLREPVAVPGWFDFVYRQNTGIAWSIQLPYALLLILNFALMAGFFRFAVRNFDFGKRTARMTVILITAGACGNIIDRLARGYVVDFISIWIWPVFNLADIFLTVGIFLILLFYARIKRN